MFDAPQPKSIENLVADIYKLFDKPEQWNPEPGNVENFARRLGKVIAERASAVRGEPRLRLSNLGVPDRKLWFTINRPEAAEPLRPEAKIKFLFGDILEELLLFLAAEAGHDVRCQQDELNVAGVTGHRDAVIDGRVVDVKSASSYSFTKFKDHKLPDDDPFGYLHQLGSYVSASGDDEVVKDKDVGSFLVIDKQLGHLCLDTYPVPDTDYEALVEHKRTVLGLPEAPAAYCYSDVPDGKSGNRKLPVGCSYCPFKFSCRPGLRTFVYSTGPVYLTHVEREPRVLEVTKDNEVVVKDF